MSRIPIPLLRDADEFYNERDSRTQASMTLANITPKRVVIVVPNQALSSGPGLETALFWTASIVRRMGRPFASTVIVAPDEFRNSQSQLAGVKGITVEQLVSGELRAADPFGPFEWRTWAEASDYRDASAILWLGTLPLAAHDKRAFVINAFGWVSIVHHAPTLDLSLNSVDFDAAPAAIIFAACIAAAKVFSQALSSEESLGTIAFALDGGVVSTDQTIYSTWLSNGGSLETTMPWKGEVGSSPSVDKLLVVSAGGIGGNFCKILGNSYISVGSAYVVEPDSFEVSNLNRAIGVPVELALSEFPKVMFAAQSLQNCAKQIFPIRAKYESWITRSVADQFQEQNTAVVVGVDQVHTRLLVASDWPFVLINGATSGSTFSTSMHVRSDGGCIGCWYGQSDATFNATRAPMACGAGIAQGPAAALAVASYPFVSVSAAALMVATLIRSAVLGTLPFSGTLTRMSLRVPENAETERIKISERCLLLCGEPYLQSELGRVATP